MYNSEEQEQKILKYWDEKKIFEKSVNERPESRPYVFYDGPPFATGLPHYGHIVASLMKDVVPRFWTMNGYRVERKWGWDCHGLPIENIIEKNLKLNSKKEIEEYGVGKFNEACRATVLQYADVWKKTIRRMGRWVDMEADYKTMDLSFMESVWWVFKELWNQDLIYQGHKAMHICPRCVTPLSNFEVTQNYKEVKDISLTAKFKLKTQNSKLKINEDLFILAWTTTPWTLPGNVLLAVGESIKYQVVSLPADEAGIKEEKGLFVVAEDRVKEVLKDKEFEVIKELTGKDLVGLEYEPLFPYFKDTPNAFKVVSAEFVSTLEGTGIVHIAPAFGDDDYQVGKKEGIPLVQHVSMDGKFTDKVEDFAGADVKPIDDPTKTDVEIIKWLAHHDKLFSKQKIEHSYPHCWRCDTPLLNYATSSWFVRVTDLKEQMLKNNQQINWVPEHIKEGRFGQWLEGSRDWAISRSRFWGAPLPVWQCEGEKVKGERLKGKNEKCDNVIVVGSAEELGKLTGKKITDLHKHKIDDLVIKCEKCGGEMKRVPEVLDCWFESGSMPYGQMHYPFENKEKFEAGFPAEFIAEGQDQTRGWFYTLHVLATALTQGKKPSIKKKKSVPAFKNVIVNGIVLAEDGKKMSKRLKNYPEPEIVINKYGADALRYYLLTSPVMSAESLNFSEAGVRESYNKVVNTLWNVLEFYKMFAGEEVKGERLKVKGESENILDKWILAKLNLLIEEVTRGMKEYKLVEAGRPIEEFITELSQWYVRRSRDRFKGDDEKDKAMALSTLRYVLLTLSKVMAPFTPFMAEVVYGEITATMKQSNNETARESVHLEEWPRFAKATQGKPNDIIEKMNLVRKIVEMGLSIRAEKGVKVRQPLAKLAISNKQLASELLDIIGEELNVKKVVNVKKVEEIGKIVCKEDGELKVGLDIEITEELKAEGLVREIVRAINQVRKNQNFTMEDKIEIEYSTDNKEIKKVLESYEEEIKRATLAEALRVGSNGEKVKINEAEISLKVIKK